MKYLFIVLLLVGCNKTEKEVKFNYHDKMFECSFTEKIYDIYKTSDDYMFELKVENYKGNYYDIKVGRKYLQENFNKDCTDFYSNRTYFRLNSVEKRLNIIEKKLNIK